MRRALVFLVTTSVVAGLAGVTALPATAAPADNPGLTHHSDHSGRELHRTTLDGAQLHHSRFEGTTMHRSSFKGAALHRSRFIDATMHRSMFHGASLHRSRFVGTTMHHSVFKKATMHTSRFIGVDMRKSVLTGASLHHSKFVDSDLRWIVAKGADLRGANFSPKRQATRAGTTSSTSLYGANLSGANLSGANLTGVDLRGANLSNATLRGTELSGTDLRTANLSGADLSTADLTNANLSGLDLSKTILAGANLTGATTTGTTMPTTLSNKLCSVSSGSNIDLGNGLVATQLTRKVTSGTVSLVAPNGSIIGGTYQCLLVAGRVMAWTVTVNQSAGAFRAPIQGLALTGQLTGSIQFSANRATWNVSAPATVTTGSLVITGTYALTSSTGWTFTPTAVTGTVAHDSTTYTASGISGLVTGSGAQESGNFNLTTSQSGRASTALLAGLPAGWTASSSISVVPTAGASLTDPATWSLVLKVVTSSANGDDSITWTGSMASAPYTMTGRGQLVLGSSSAPVTGTLTASINNQSAWALTAVVNSQIGEGATVTGNLTASSAQPGISGLLNVAPASGTFTFQAAATFQSSTSWTLTANGSGSSDWTVPGFGGTGTFTIPVSSVSGTITDSDNTITWDLTATLNQWNGPQGIRLSGAVEISNECPVASLGCSDLSGIFIGASGTLAHTQLGTFAVVGAGLADGSWMVLEGQASGTASYTGPNGTTVSVANPGVSVWKGSRPDCPISSITLPDISDGNFALELSGTMSATIPAVGSASLAGCLDVNSDGNILIGQNVNGAANIGGAGVSGGTSGASSYGVVSSAAISSWAWTNAAVDDGTTVTLGGQTFDISPSTVYLAGKVTLRGYLASELGISSKPTAPVLMYFQYDADNVRDSTFFLSSTITPNVSANGIDLTAVTLSATKQGTNYTFSLEADASVTVNDSTVDVVGDFSAGSSDGKGYLRFSVSATGTMPAGATLPSQYDFVADDYLGIPGLYLWSITGQLELVDGFPGAGLSTSTYLDPTQQPLLFQGTTWVQGGTTFNISEADACISMGFDSSDTSTYAQIKGGVFETTDFSFAFAESGCTVGSVTIPAGMSFTLDTSLGSDNSLSITMEETIDSDGSPSYYANVAYDGNLGGMSLDGDLVISMDASSEDVSFTGSMTMPFGTMSASYDLSADTSGDIVVKGDVYVNASVGSFNWTRTASSKDTSSDGIFSVQSLSYSIDMNVGSDNCGDYDTSTSGTLTYGAKSGVTFVGDIDVNCGVLEDLNFAIDYSHGGVPTDELVISYSSKTGLLYGQLVISPALWETSSTHLSYTYKRHVQFTISITVSIDTVKASNSYVTLGLALSADDVSGSATCTFEASGDDYCKASVKIAPSGTTYSWSDSWTW